MTSANKITKIFVLLIISFVVSGCASSREFSAYLQSEDKFNPGVKTYFSDRIPLTKTSMFTLTKGDFSLFSTSSGENRRWHIETTYISENWLFVEALQFNVDDKIYALNSQPNPIRDIGYVFSGVIREVNRFNVNDDLISALSAANTVYARLSGRNYYHEKKLTPNEIKNVKWYIGYINNVTTGKSSGGEKQ